MTALCGGGTSAPKLLPELAATYGAGRLAQLLVAAGVGELSAWLPLVGLIPVVYSTFCSTDPPTMVALTRAESDALANTTLGADYFSGLGKFKDVCLNLIWNDVCHCTSGAYTAPVPPAIDANTPVYIVPTPQQVQPCFDLTTGSLLFDGRTLITINEFLNGLIPTSFRFTTTSAISTGSGGTSVRKIAQLKLHPTASTLQEDDITQNVSQTITTVRAIQPGTEQIQVFYTSASVSGGSSIGTDRLELFCGGDAPGALQAPCCPPDPATQAYLDLILQQVNLLQRQLSPFSYIASTVHAGLSGAGHISIQGLLGIQVNVTTLPGSIGREGTSPVEYFDMGWITFGTADGYPSAFRLERNPQVTLPARCSAFTDLDYDLAPGVIVTITELLREP
jgi:hypothetical protein